MQQSVPLLRRRVYACTRGRRKEHEEEGDNTVNTRVATFSRRRVEKYVAVCSTTGWVVWREGPRTVVPDLAEIPRHLLGHGIDRVEAPLELLLAR